MIATKDTQGQSSCRYVPTVNFFSKNDRIDKIGWCVFAQFEDNRILKGVRRHYAAQRSPASRLFS